MTPTSIEASGISVRAGGATLLDDVSLAVHGGETVALVGPNGAGKSTLLRVLAGEIAPLSGFVALRGKRLTQYNAKALALERAVLSQSTVVTFPFTVAEIVRMGAGDRRGTFVEQQIDRALSTVDLSALRERIVTTLSGGEQQRAHFARILVQLACGEAARGPGVLMLDEPTASLDLRHQLDLLEAMKHSAARGIAVIVVLHDLNLASLCADRIIMLDRGRIAAAGTAHDTINDETLARVFKVRDAVNRIPRNNNPFVLPHAAS